MKVSKCSEKAEAKTGPRQYSYAELGSTAPEGVYATTAGAYSNSTRWIVLISIYSDKRVLLVHQPGELSISGGATGPFIKTNEPVCFELKDA